MRCGPSWKAASDEKQLEAESLEVSGACKVLEDV